MVLDQASDKTGAMMIRLATLLDPPIYVKQASAAVLKGEGLPAHLYGDQVEKMFAAHTPAATWMSAAYFYNQRGEILGTKSATVERRLRKSAANFGILADLDKISDFFDKEGAVSELAMADRDFALVMEYPDSGAKVRHYPLRNGKEVKTAVEYLRKSRPDFRYRDRQRIAQKIEEKAAELSVELPKEDQELLARVGGIGTCSLKTLTNEIVKRAETMRHRPETMEMAEKLVKLARDLTNEPEEARRPARIAAIAQVLDDIDYAQGRPTGRLVEDDLFCLNVKSAEDFKSATVATPTGMIYDLESLMRIPLQEYREVLGDDVADAMCKEGIFLDREGILEVVPTLPRGSAERLDRLAESKHIEPLRKMASLEALTEDSILRLASEFELAAR